MEQFEKVIKALQLTKSNPVEGWDYRGEGFDGAMVHTSTALIDAALALIRQQQERIKELEAAIAGWEKFAPFLYAHGMLPEPPKEGT